MSTGSMTKGSAAISSTWKPGRGISERSEPCGERPGGSTSPSNHCVYERVSMWLGSLAPVSSFCTNMWR